MFAMFCCVKGPMVMIEGEVVSWLDLALVGLILRAWKTLDGDGGNEEMRNKARCRLDLLRWDVLSFVKQSLALVTVSCACAFHCL